MNDMDPVHVAGNAVQTTLTYFDGQQRSVLALAIERQASAQPSLAERVSRPKTRAILGLMRLNFLSVFRLLQHVDVERSVVLVHDVTNERSHHPAEIDDDENRHGQQQ